MKTGIKGLLAILLGLFMFSSFTTKAQCAKIANQTQCTVKLTITQYKKNPTTGLCNVVCGTPLTITIPPGGSAPIDCICNQCNISITVIALNGMVLSPPVTVDYTSGPQMFPPNPCGANGIQYNASIPGFIIF